METSHIELGQRFAWRRCVINRIESDKPFWINIGGQTYKSLVGQPDGQQYSLQLNFPMHLIGYQDFKVLPVHSQHTGYAATISFTLINHPCKQPNHMCLFWHNNHEFRLQSGLLYCPDTTAIHNLPPKLPDGSLLTVDTDCTDCLHSVWTSLENFKQLGQYVTINHIAFRLLPSEHVKQSEIRVNRQACDSLGVVPGSQVLVQRITDLPMLVSADLVVTYVGFQPRFDSAQSLHSGLMQARKQLYSELLHSLVDTRCQYLIVVDNYMWLASFSNLVNNSDRPYDQPYGLVGQNSLFFNKAIPNQPTKPHYLTNPTNLTNHIKPSEPIKPFNPCTVHELSKLVDSVKLL
jgi:hypothetical protein